MKDAMNGIDEVSVKIDGALLKDYDLQMNDQQIKQLY